MYLKWLYMIIPIWLCFSCKDKELPAQYLTTMSVVRESSQPSVASKPSSLTKVQTPPAVVASQAEKKYHIIVGSFALSAKTKAEKLVQQLHTEKYPASLLTSSQRYRVSIESFVSENEANKALDKYRKITNRQDIWVYKSEN